MAVKLRLKRTGRHKRPFYRICVFDGRTRRDGRPIEELGSYDPRASTWDEKVKLRRARAHYWLTVGAQPSETVKSILRRMGVRKDGPVPVDEEPVKAEVVEAPAVAEAVASDSPVEPVAESTDETGSDAVES